MKLHCLLFFIYVRLYFGGHFFIFSTCSQLFRTYKNDGCFLRFQSVFSIFCKHNGDLHSAIVWVSNTEGKYVRILLRKGPKINLDIHHSNNTVQSWKWVYFKVGNRNKWNNRLNLITSTSENPPDIFRSDLRKLLNDIYFMFPLIQLKISR